MRGARNASQAVVSISKMLSVMCLEEIHRCEGCMHLMVCQWRPRQIAEVRSLQSQLNSVNGRSASGDVAILPLSSMSEVLGIKTVLLSAKCSGTVPPPNRNQKALKRNWVPSHPAHQEAPYGIPSGPGAESFFMAMSSSNSVLSIVQRMSSGAF